MLLTEITSYLDGYLRTAEIADWSGAMNGLQLENAGEVSSVAAAVDCTLPVIEKTVASGANLLLVHHGLFWSGAQPFCGSNYRKIKLAMDAGLAIYSSHLPLDLHPEVGNNAELVRLLELSEVRPFFPEKGAMIGLRGRSEMSCEELTHRLENILGVTPHLAPGGPEIVREIGVVTGGAGGEVARAAAAGVDTFITGEGPNHSFGLAEELGINLFYGGHYATETFGARALAAHLMEKFGLPWQFIDHPTGL